MSFLRLKKTLSEAINTDASPAVDFTLANYTQVALNPYETYLQYSDVLGGVDFDGNYTVHICDCSGRELLDITEKVAILEMIVGGVTQFAFEIAYVNQEFYTPVILKFKHGVSDLTLYSNRFIVKNSATTTRIDYLDYSRPVNFYQSIRLNMYFDREDADSEISEYTQINGNKVSGRAIVTNLQHFVFEYLDGFTFRNLNNMLTMPIVYLNGIRVTNKQILKSDKRASDANWWEQEIEVPTNYEDTFTDSFQIFDNFEVVEFVPFGVNTTASAGTELKVIFNKDFTLNTDVVIQLFKGWVLNQTFTFSDVTASGNEISVDCGALTNDEYYVTVTANAVTSIHGENSEFLTWEFEVVDGEYDEDDYDNNEYLTD